MFLSGEHRAGFAESENKPPPQKPFQLPDAHSDMRRVFAYLIKERCIDREVIRHFAKAGTLFEDSKYKDWNEQLKNLCQDEPEMAMSM